MSPGRFSPLCGDAQKIWRAGVRAVVPASFMAESVFFDAQNDGGILRIVSDSDDESAQSRQKSEFLLPPKARMTVIGFGKASGAMAEAFEKICAEPLRFGRLSGFVNVPDDQVRPLRSIDLHGGRPSGRNEPTAAGLWGTEKIVESVQQSRPDDIIVALVSGGGSALLPLPIPEITLEQKCAITRFLSAAGANIVELNTVRGALSQVKAGGLRRLARGKRLVSLILSDVPGNRLEIIAGGPTVASFVSAADALAVLRRFQAPKNPSLKAVCQVLEHRAERQNRFNESLDLEGFEHHAVFILGDNRRAVRAAAKTAGCSFDVVLSESADQPEGEAETVGRALLARIRAEYYLHNGKSVALVSGGEPVVELVDSSFRGKGGRNTQLVLAALIEALRRPNPVDERLVFLSGGTDGEDGPTDAAGAFFDAETLRRVRQLESETNEAFRPEDYLARNDAYSFFQKIGGLLQTGPTGTNVCDLRFVGIK